MSDDAEFHAYWYALQKALANKTPVPPFHDGKPQGGTGVDVGSVEFRQRFGESWGAVAFVDAGQVGTTGVPFNGNASVGAGAGVRYYTAIGPIRADVAVPLTHQPKEDAFELYLGLGQSF